MKTNRTSASKSVSAAESMARHEKKAMPVHGISQAQTEPAVQAKAQGNPLPQTLSLNNVHVIPETYGQAAANTPVLQPQWAYLDVDGGTSLNLAKTADPTVYTLNRDGSKYKVIGTAADGRPIVSKVNDRMHAEWRHDQFSAYQNWTKSSHGVSVAAPFGTGNINAYHNRGAPKISSRQQDFGNAQLGDTYEEYVRGLQSGGDTDAAIAQALLDMNDDVLITDLQQRAASMLHVTVYLAEEWRKQGAAKLYRALLRTIAAGNRDFSTFADDFRFIISADEGRYQVARFNDVQQGHKTQGDLSRPERLMYGNMSPMRDHDMDSEDDLADEKKLEKTRDHSHGNKGTKGWKDPWQ